MRIVPYQAAYSADWNQLVEEAKNGTFLWNRNFMDYHAHRFEDCSLMAYEGDRLVAALPAHRDGNTVCSHGGLTYGGLILSRSITAKQTLEAWCGMVKWYIGHLRTGRLVCKPIPYIYSVYPSEEMLYALFRSGAVLKARTLSSTLPLHDPLPLRTLRMRGVKKAVRGGWQVVEDRSDGGMACFWKILEHVLDSRHQIKPAHTVEEMELLRGRFPEQIRLFTVKRADRMAGGCVVFATPAVVHIQYIAASEEGCSCGALDLLFHYLITERFSQATYLDFGVSTEDGGHWLNEGLVFQKEGFGGRGVCYDTYEIDFANGQLADLLNEYGKDSEPVALQTVLKCPDE